MCSRGKITEKSQKLLKSYQKSAQLTCDSRQEASFIFKEFGMSIVGIKWLEQDVDGFFLGIQYQEMERGSKKRRRLVF